MTKILQRLSCRFPGAIGGIVGAAALLLAGPLVTGAQTPPRPEMGLPPAKYKMFMGGAAEIITLPGHFQLLEGGKYRVSIETIDKPGDGHYFGHGEYRYTPRGDRPAEEKTERGRIEFLSGYFKEQQQTNRAFKPNAITGRHRVTEWHVDRETPGKERRIHRIDFNGSILGEYLEYRDLPRR